LLNEILPGNNKNVLYLICKYKAICYACLSRYKESIKYYILAGRANPNYSDYLLIKIKFLLGIIGEEIEGLKPGFFPFSIIQNFTKISIKPNYLFSNGREQKTVIHNDFTETLHQDAIPLNQILFTFQNKRLSFLSKNLIYLSSSWRERKDYARLKCEIWHVLSTASKMRFGIVMPFLLDYE